MARSKWLMGCGVGCIGILLLIAGAGVTLFQFVQSTKAHVEAIGKTHEHLISLHGEVTHYVPPPDGVVPLERALVFMKVRNVLVPHQANLEAEIQNTVPADIKTGDAGFWDVMVFLKRLSGVFPSILDYIHFRNTALVEEGMGLGEYLYIYTLAYHSGKNHLPSDGPEIETDGRRERIFNDDEGSGSFSEERIMRDYNRSMIQILENQLEGITDMSSDYRAALVDEIAAMKADVNRVIWQSNPQPQPNLDQLAEELMAAYNAAVNCFEWGPMDTQEWKNDGNIVNIEF